MHSPQGRLGAVKGSRRPQGRLCGGPRETRAAGRRGGREEQGWVLREAEQVQGGEGPAFVRK